MVYKSGADHNRHLSYTHGVSLAPSPVGVHPGVNAPLEALPDGAFPSSSVDNLYYAELKQRVRDANLIRPPPGLFLLNLAWTSVAVGIGIYLLSLTNNTVLLLIGAV